MYLLVHSLNRRLVVVSTADAFVGGRSRDPTVAPPTASYQGMVEHLQELLLLFTLCVFSSTNSHGQILPHYGGQGRHPVSIFL